MSQETLSQNGEQEKSLTNAEENQNKVNSGEELIERHPIEGTPFMVVGNKDNGYFIAMGRFRISETAGTLQKAAEMLITNQWEIIGNMIITMWEAMHAEGFDKTTS